MWTATAARERGALFKTVHRSAGFRTNRFQRVYFIPVILAFVCGCVIAWLSLVYFLTKTYPLNPDFQPLVDRLPGIISLFTLSMIFLIYWTSRLTNRYFGYYQRIIQELDDVLTEKKSGPLEARKDDIIFTELFNRINALIQRKT